MLQIVSGFILKQNAHCLLGVGEPHQGNRLSLLFPPSMFPLPLLTCPEYADRSPGNTAFDDFNFPTGTSPGKYRSHHATLRNLKSATPGFIMGGWRRGRGRETCITYAKMGRDCFCAARELFPVIRSLIFLSLATLSRNGALNKPY